MKVVFMGTPEFAVAALDACHQNFEVVAVYTQPDKPFGRGLEMRPSPVKARALQLGLPVYTPEKVSVPEELARIQNLHADVCVVVAYGQILKQNIIDATPHGCVNIHASLLPRWRGAAPIQWSILAGDPETGVTTMKIVQKLDAGDMLLRKKIPILPEDNSDTLFRKLSALGAELIVPTLEGLRDGTLQLTAQDETLVTYAHKLTKEMENLNFSQPCVVVWNAIRALNPWPGCRIFPESGAAIKIKSASMPVATSDAGAVLPNSAAIHKGCGTLWVHQGDLFLGCADGGIKINQLQEEGKKTVTSAEFIQNCKARGTAFPIKLKEQKNEK